MLAPPLWPAGHLPHRWGDRLGACSLPQAYGFFCSAANYAQLEAKVVPLVISPLVGEMPGRAEGAVARDEQPHTSSTTCNSLTGVAPAIRFNSNPAINRPASDKSS
ncbi:hypothetical protein D3C71_694230 [compost metagenome]